MSAPPYAVMYPLRDIRDYGGVGDGVTDNSDALERAVAAGPGTIVLRGGNYHFAQGIPLPLRNCDLLVCGFWDGVDSEATPVQVPTVIVQAGDILAKEGF